ncbi:hypothetical protein SMICM304S_05901 [Streptomyces microflavus]
MAAPIRVSRSRCPTVEVLDTPAVITKKSAVVAP